MKVKKLRNNRVSKKRRVNWDELLRTHFHYDPRTFIHTKKTLWYVIAKLPEQRRSVIVRRFGIGEDGPMTLQEIADEDGITKQAVLMQLNRIKKSMDNALSFIASGGTL